MPARDMHGSKIERIMEGKENCLLQARVKLMTKARRTNQFFLGLIVFYIIACFFLVPLLPERYISNNSGIILSQMIIALPGIVYIIGTRGRTLQDIRFKRIGFLNIILLILFTLFMVPAISFINALSMMFVKNHMAEQLGGMNTNPLWLNLILIAFIPAIVEEMIFRGLIYCGYRDSVIKRAIFASALLFGLFHMNINQFCYAAFMAVVFALLYEATGSIFATMIVHFTFNANTVILQKLIELYQELVTKLAETDDSFKKIAEQLTESGSRTTTSFASYPLMEKVYMLVSLFITAFITGIIAVVIFKVIAQRFHRQNHVRQILCSLFGMRCKDREIKEDEYIEDNKKEYGGKIVDHVFILGVILCITMMIYTGI